MTFLRAAGETGLPAYPYCLAKHQLLTWVLTAGAQQTADAHFLTRWPWSDCRYVSQVIVSDMTVKKKWHFQCSCWLAVDLGRCERDRVFTPASRRELSSFRYNCSCRHWCVLRRLYLSSLLLVELSIKISNSWFWTLLGNSFLNQNEWLQEAKHVNLDKTTNCGL